MTEQEYQSEQAWIEAQERHMDYIEDCVLDNMFSDENIFMLRKGFDLVCMVNSGSMLASECLMACSCRGEAEIWARKYQAETKIGNLVVIYADGDRACDWLIIDESAFN